MDGSKALPVVALKIKFFKLRHCAQNKPNRKEQNDSKRHRNAPQCRADSRRVPYAGHLVAALNRTLEQEAIA